ncbi:hypothetical protein V496_07821 [Pseudogymnoascus sp. VKM F-4515 (FW-2607)]|nr:hypothetical protein V496_07821 [Pseudogymnoascus sp. VKM F-4515 (FW-2607)]
MHIILLIKTKTPTPSPLDPSLIAKARNRQTSPNGIAETIHNIEAKTPIVNGQLPRSPQLRRNSSLEI